MTKIDEIQAKVDARMREIDERMGRIGEVSAEPSPPSGDIQISRSALQIPDVPVAAPAASTAAEGIRLAVALSSVPSAAAPEMWETSPNELLQLMQYVCSSPHVTSNARYAELPRKLHFKVDVKESTVNAYAVIAEGDVPTIKLLGGAIRFANLASAAYVGAEVVREKRGEGNPLPEITAALGKWCLEKQGKFSSESACEFAEKYNLHLVMAEPTLARKAKSFSAGLLIGILAHELGHLALGHCHGRGVNLEVSRNQEREADSFASSVISSSPFGDYLVFGTILWEAVWVWVEKATGKIASSHPLSSERLADLVRANPSVASELGISLEGLTS